MTNYLKSIILKSNFSAMVLVLFCVVSCQSQGSSNNKNTESTDTNASEVAAEAAPQAPLDTTKGKYGIKSGIVVYKTQMMGMEALQTLSFDDYGKREVTDIMMEMMGTEIHTVTLTKDGYVYTLDMVNKTGTSAPVNPRNNANIDFQNLSETMAKDMNLKKEGTEAFLGRTCEKMSIDYAKMQLKGTFLVYKGVALKTDTDMGTMKMKLVAEEFEENPKIPAEKFEIPNDITMAGN